jgi:hypothetical protein
MYFTHDSLLPENQEKRLSCATPVARRARMQGYVLTLCLLVGMVWSASAQQMDPKLVGTWESYDGPCNPCTLTIGAGTVDNVSFAQAGSAVQVVYARATPEYGIDLILPQGGKLDLGLNKKGNYLVGFYTTWTQNRSDIPVSFERK